MCTTAREKDGIWRKLVPSPSPTPIISTLGVTTSFISTRTTATKTVSHRSGVLQEAQGTGQIPIDIRIQLYKPEQLMRALVRDYSKPGHLVVDLCMRHGISGVACNMEQRAFIGIEYEAESYTIAVNRFKDQSGEPEPTYVSPLTSPISRTSTPLSVSDIVLPSSTPIPRPRGRSRKDSWWDTSRGLWVTNRLPTALPTETPLVCEGDDYEVDRMDNDDDELSMVTPTKKQRVCGTCTPGCFLPDHPIGLCSSTSVHKRTRSR